VAGGSADREARYLDPTILYPVTWDDPIMEDEIFGPILPVLTYKDMDAAIREVKKHPKLPAITRDVIRADSRPAGNKKQCFRT